MSLNWKEIDLVLGELDLEGAHIQRILQPSYDSIVLGLYKEGREIDLLISIANGACRMHSLAAPPPKPERALRFQECLKSRIKGGHIDAVSQLGTERVVRFDVTVSRVDSGAAKETVYKPIGSFAHDLAHGRSPARGRLAANRRGTGLEAEAPSEPTRQVGPEIQRYRIYARLWSGAGNIILVDEAGTIIDVAARRPAKGEVSGEACRLEESIAVDQGRPHKEFVIRGLPPLDEERRRRKPAPGRIPVEGGSFNERLELAYAEHGGELSRDKLLSAARERFAKKMRALDARIAEFEKRAALFRDADRFRELGDILMANQASPRSSRLLSCADFHRGGEVAIEIDPALSIMENARSYYGRYRKAVSGLGEVELELSACKAARIAEEAGLARLEACANPLLIAKALDKGGTTRTEANRDRAYPGLSLEKNGWTILVGRSAKENDELLRRHVRGNDLWMHARDYAGSHVFVKSRSGKSFPLDILLDAGNLAIYYSKGRANGGGELYYTLVKHLRRAKDGPKGLVLPSQEKNLYVNLDEKLLRGLRALIGEE